ncbi:MAG: hypothetical protein AAF560_00380 [Acidobacteriota bacterium]
MLQLISLELRVAIDDYQQPMSLEVGVPEYAVEATRHGFGSAIDRHDDIHTGNVRTDVINTNTVDTSGARLIVL